MLGGIINIEVDHSLILSRITDSCRVKIVEITENEEQFGYDMMPHLNKKATRDKIMLTKTRTTTNPTKGEITMIENHSEDFGNF